ncbi:MAG TPA: CRTAC1 family protein, partial [Bryobacteraceae bacterium]
LDLFVANYIDFDPKTAPLPESGSCKYKGILVACGPPGLQGGKNILFHNRGDGTFADVSEKAGILNTQGTFGLGVGVFDFDNDSWPDIYVANDSTSSALYKNKHDGTFQEIAIEAGVAYSADGKPQAGMGVAVADYDCDGNFDLVKTNFAGDTVALYRNLGGGFFEDQTFQAGLGRITRFLGWGAAFLDFDNDGWADIMLCNGHVYPEVGESATESGYKQRKVAYQNLRNGKFREVSEELGPGILEKVSGRGMAVGDFDNDGDLDLLVNCINDVPQLLRCDSRLKNNWIKIKTTGTKSNRTGIGARIICTTEIGGKPHRQMDEVRSGGSYISQNDLRVHFGLGPAAVADIEVRWPSGIVDKLPKTAANRVITVVEGQGK